MAFPNDRGIGPFNRFCPRNSSIPGFLKEPKLAGIEPDSRLARRSSRVISVRREREAGIGPVNRLLDRSSRFNAVRRPRLSGIEPESLPVSWPSVEGIEPVMMFPERSREVSLLSRPRDSGMGPVSPLLSSRVWRSARLAIEPGMGPVRLPCIWSDWRKGRSPITGGMCWAVTNTSRLRLSEVTRALVLQ
ncbi:hypothetical protein Cgig2_012137 [Carnegiea gigantea]|uniref:Uncharacterized protein n=1 Tax=Carnegiea gigantea TaxID=171969 RepID=A0A9Q1KRZ6_9CARY|nr:hypothetical protein Cgig2_012137 [Carnegiea gigantea]